jgi:hypothetical protein
LNIGRPLSESLLLVSSAPVRRLVNEIVTGQRFPDVCVETAKRFRRGKELFRPDAAGETIHGDASGASIAGGSVALMNSFMTVS